MNLETLSRPVARGAAWKRAACAALAATLTLFTFTACGGSDDDDEVVVDRGPTTIEIQAKLNGLYWDPGQSRLYLTGDDANAIRAWDDKKDFPVFADLPAMGAGERTTLGQLTRDAAGTLYTTRFGFSAYGAVVAVPESRVARNLDGLDVTRRRIGIIAAPDGTLIDGWFAGPGSVGHVSEVTLDGAGGASERELITGLGKPTGLALVGDWLYVSDQFSGELRRYSLADLRARATPAQPEDGELFIAFTPSDSLDLMVAATDGTLYFGGGGTLYQVGPAVGQSKKLAEGWPGILGVALDAANKRLFAAVKAEVADGPASIRIVPLD